MHNVTMRGKETMNRWSYGAMQDCFDTTDWSLFNFVTGCFSNNIQTFVTFCKRIAFLSSHWSDSTMPCPSSGVLKEWSGYTLWAITHPQYWRQLKKQAILEADIQGRLLAQSQTLLLL